MTKDLNEVVEESKTSRLENQLRTFQDGMMTYYHIFDNVNKNDRFNISCLLSELGAAMESSLVQHPDAHKLLEDIEETLCELDSMDPSENCEYAICFAEIFNSIGIIRKITGYTEVY